ncbi:unnamed protein product [Phytophthora fragariaefolia]|uniref:Unnamed protein product n=1 Tax=Phytophthora fragariaefolia TaxID=1490495 RepID=A0A9W6YAL8_9STRA|nr:unnamed protein product [Phytophthora fragariaefolia]
MIYQACPLVMYSVLPDSAHCLKISIDTEDQLAKNRMPPAKDGGKATLRGPNWDHGEDKALAKAWLVISKDGITSTDQKGDDFWERVAAKFNEFDRFLQVAAQMNVHE